MIIDLCKTVTITPKGCHGLTEELCHPFGVEHCVTSVNKKVEA
jgi:hypothetical protein